jgi:pyrrolidone-carboxylate peptidase
MPKHGANRMRILIYGFGPYRQFRENITAKIIDALPRRAGLKKLVFPVRFQRALFVQALKHNSDIVVGLGQSSRRAIEIETRAVNRRSVGTAEKVRPIFTRENKHLATTLKVKAGRSAKVSKDAGDYVCNYSMYVMLREIARENLNVSFGFIHIPHDYDEGAARRFIEGVLRQCYRSRTRRIIKPATKLSSRGKRAFPVRRSRAWAGVVRSSGSGA